MEVGVVALPHGSRCGMWSVDLILQSPNLRTIVALCWIRREKDCGIENSALWERNSATATGTDGVSLMWSVAC